MHDNLRDVVHTEYLHQSKPIHRASREGNYDDKVCLAVDEVGYGIFRSGEMS